MGHPIPRDVHRVTLTNIEGPSGTGPLAPSWHRGHAGRDCPGHFDGHGLGTRAIKMEEHQQGDEGESHRNFGTSEHLQITRSTRLGKVEQFSAPARRIGKVFIFLGENVRESYNNIALLGFREVPLLQSADRQRPRGSVAWHAPTS